MGTAIVLRIPIDNLFWLSLINPLQVFKMAAILDINTTLDILGPAGVYAMQEYGDDLLWVFVATLAIWICVPAALAYFRLVTKADL